LGLTPSDCIGFEDTRRGIDAGLSARMQVVGLLTAYSAADFSTRRPSLIFAM
jgi:beta-phosphoglucomutase-like phosphatase (HAD superfamily)